MYTCDGKIFNCKDVTRIPKVYDDKNPKLFKIKEQDVLHNYIDIVCIFKCIIKLDQVSMSRQSFQYLHLPTNIFNCYCGRHLPNNFRFIINFSMKQKHWQSSTYKHINTFLGGVEKNILNIVLTLNKVEKWLTLLQPKLQLNPAFYTKQKYSIPRLSVFVKLLLQA